jgi:UDPglucose--hexose-1-phosphate uridylyltransferase
VLRFNELRGEEVVYAAHRQDRMHLPGRDACPFCPGSDQVPASFDVAVIPNRWPALEAAEVIVYGEDHDASFATLPAERAQRIVEVWRDRYAELGARPDVHYVMPFENRGEEVGVTLHHPHGQVYGFPFVPPVPAAEREADRRLGACAVCVAAERERDSGERLVHENASFAAYVPYAARWPYEVHVTARAHAPSLLDCEPRQRADFAAALQAVTRGYDELLGAPLPYMLCVHQAPTDGGGDGHLHAELYSPVRARGKLKHLAGCEQGAGTMLVDVLPETTAAELKAAIARAS